MQELDQLLGSNGMDLAGLAARFGVSPDQAQSALGSLMPAVLGGFQKKAETNDLAPVTDAVASASQPDTDTGNGVLGHIFGSKDVSRQVADHAAGQSGVSSTVIQAMLPVVAAMVARHIAGQGASGQGTAGQGASGQGASGQGGDGSAPAGGGGLGGLLGSFLGGGSAGGSLGGLGGLLGGGGNPLDQILAKMR